MDVEGKPKEKKTDKERMIWKKKKMKTEEKKTNMPIKSKITGKEEPIIIF